MNFRKWKMVYCFKLLHENKRNYIVLVLNILTILLAFISLCFHEGVQSFNSASLYGNYDYLTCSISKVNITEIEGSFLKLQESRMPSVSEINSIIKTNNASWDYDYSYTIGNFISTKINGISIEEPFKPVFINAENICSLYKGEFLKRDSLNEIVINKACYDKYFDNVNLLNKKLSYTRSITISSYFEDNKYQDIIDLNFDFRVVGVVEEKALISTPCFYYSQNAARSFVKSIPLTNVSSARHQSYTLYDRMSESSSNDVINNYCCLMGFDDVESLLMFAKSIQTQSRYSLSSSTVMMNDSFYEITVLIDKLLKIFFFIICLSLILTYIIQSYIFINMRTVDLGILNSLGMSSSKIRGIFAYTSIGFFSISFIISILLFGPTYLFINNFIPHTFEITNLLIFNFHTFVLLLLGICLMMFVLYFLMSCVLRLFLNKKTSYLIREE